MSLKLYLSGATKYGGLSQPDLSIGKYPSVEEIQNAMIGNLFGDLSEYTILKRRDEVRAIVLQNDSATVPLTDLKVWIEYPVDAENVNTSATEYELGAAVLIADKCGDPIFPSTIKSIYSLPMGVTFSVNVNEANALPLGTLAPEGTIGLWIKRKIKPITPLTDEQLEAITAGTLEINKREDIIVKFSWI